LKDKEKHNKTVNKMKTIYKVVGNLVDALVEKYEARKAYLKHGVKVGSIVRSCYGDKYLVTNVRYWSNGLPTLKGKRLGEAGRLLTEEVLINVATNNGVVELYK